MMSRTVAVLAMWALGSSALAADVGTALSAEQARGRELFISHCAACHGERGHATTLLAKRVGQEQAQIEKRRNLNAEFVRVVVRNGMNSMPWFRRAELSDGDLDVIANYLVRSNSSK